MQIEGPIPPYASIDAYGPYGFGIEVDSGHAKGVLQISVPCCHLGFDQTLCIFKSNSCLGHLLALDSFNYFEPSFCSNWFQDL